MKKLSVFLAGLLLAGITMVQAQTVRITGTVTSSEDGMPMPGVSVFVQGTTIGITTNVDGKYELNVPADAQTLTFSFVGYATQDVAIAGRSVVDVVMQPEAVQMEEVIVVAYGVVKAEAKTGSVTQVKGTTLTDVPTTSVDKILAGKLAGVQVTSSSGQPGANMNIRIRGISSINAGNEPLWVVDGIPVMTGDQSFFTNTGNAIALINPSDIESITVLKDAAAASVYGSRAANGVVLVTTKSGKEGDAKFNIRAKYGASALANDNDYKVMNGQQLLEYQRTAIVNAGLDPDDPTGPYYRPNSLLALPQTNWMAHFTRPGLNQEIEVNATGGNNKGAYYNSLAYQKTQGVFYGIDYTKVTGRINADYKLTKTLTTGAHINLAYTDANDVPMQALYYANPIFAGMTILPWTPKYNADGTHNINIPENSRTNPRATAEYDDQWEKQYRTISSIYLEWKPIKNLSIKTTNGLETTFGEGRRYWSPLSSWGWTTGTLQTSRNQYVQLTTSNTITYSNTFNESHFLKVLAGQEAMKRDYNYMYIYSPDVDPNIPYPTTSTPASDETDYYLETRTLLSYFGILEYNFKGKYFLSSSLRADGSSLFGQNNTWGTFWSVGLSWNISSEEFMKGFDFIDLLKVRASYGVNGNNNIPAYRAYGVYASTVYNGFNGMLPSRPSNPDLTWETNKTINGGLDFAFLKNRISGSIDVYQRKTEDMLLDKKVPQTTGFSTNFMNIGSLENKGLEIQLNGDIIRSNDIIWNAGFNIAFNRSKILDLGGEEFLTAVVNGSLDSRLRHVVDESFYQFYVYDYYGVNPTNGEALWYDANGNLTSNFNLARRVYKGSPEPKFTGGFNTMVSWKGLSLSAFFEFKGGNYVGIFESRYLMSDGNQMSMNQNASLLNYWKNVGDTGVNPIPYAGNTSNSYSASSSRYLQKGDFLRIKDITLSYTLPKTWVEKVKLSTARVYLSGYNLYTFHDVDFWDPERGVEGMGFGIYPMTKSIVGGIEISF